jgi:hypothetical protein
MQHVCETSPDIDDRPQCLKLSKTFALGTTTFGCMGYSELQQEHCACVPRELAVDRVTQYLQAFYDHYNGTHALPQKFVNKYVSELHPKTGEPKNETEFQRDLGTAIFALYKKYPESIDIISRDGKSGRNGGVYFGDAQPIADADVDAADADAGSDDASTVDEETTGSTNNDNDEEQVVHLQEKIRDRLASLTLEQLQQMDQFLATMDPPASADSADANIHIKDDDNINSTASSPDEKEQPVKKDEPIHVIQREKYSNLEKEILAEIKSEWWNK